MMDGDEGFIYASSLLSAPAHHLRFYLCTDGGWELEKDSVETCVINLSCRAHEP